MVTAFTLDTGFLINKVRALALTFQFVSDAMGRLAADWLVW